MKARILDSEALRAISPVALRAYAIFEGWKKVDVYGQYSEVYVRPTGDNFKAELIVPFTTHIGDYAIAIAQAIRFISQYENRDELAVYADLIIADRDVVRVRAPDADDDGSIGVDPGRELVQHARDLLASAACAALEPRRTYHMGKIQQAEEYMKRVRLGQTERGSFVVTLLTPIPPDLTKRGEQLPIWPEMEEEPYERQVTRVLSQALHSAHEAIVANNRGDGLAAFNDAVARGVSANLCEAVAAIVDQAQGADLSVTWARTRPTPTPRDRITFERSDAEVLREAGRQFRLREPRPEERILGYVTHLRRPEDEFDGRVTIKALIDGKVRSITADLLKRDYEIALEANRTQVPVSAIGNLRSEGHRWRLVDPTNIRMLEEDTTTDEGD